MSAAELEAGYGRWFLLHNAGSAARASADADADTMTVDSIPYVAPLLRRPESRQLFVSIGRHVNNDVALADASVSQFHAFLKDIDGIPFLQDAGSKNGTFVGEVPVPAQRQGAPVRLSGGETIRFGAVATTFLDVDAVRRMLPPPAAAV